MWRITTGLVMIILLVLFGASAVFAQDVTPEPTADVVGEVVVDDALVVDVTNTMRQSVTDIVAVVVGAIGAVVVILAGTFAVVLARLGGHLYQSVPMYYRDSVSSFLDTFTLRLQDLAKATPTPFEFDDVFADKLREVVNQQLAVAIAQAKAKSDTSNG